MEFVIFDTEYTTWEGCNKNGWHDWQKKEVVQIVALKVSADDLSVIEEFSYFIKPKFNPILSDYFINLTKIDNVTIQEKGVDFEFVYNKFKDFVGDLVVYSHGWSLATTGIADGEVLNENLEYYGLKDDNKPNYVNIAPWFMKEYKMRNISIQKQCSGEIAKLLGCEGEISHLGLSVHNALYDTYSILAGLKYLGFNFEKEAA